MPDRKSFVTAAWLLSSLVLLAALLAAPIRTSAAVTLEPQTPRLDLARMASDPTPHLSAVTVINTVLPVNALLVEEEEQDRAVAPDGSRVSCLVVDFFRQAHTRQWIAPSSTPSFYPLRS